MALPQAVGSYTGISPEVEMNGKVSLVDGIDNLRYLRAAGGRFHRTPWSFKVIMERRGSEMIIVVAVEDSWHVVEQS